MANVLYRLSTKRFNDQAEVLVRFYSGRFEQSAHTRVYVPIKSWSADQRRLVFSKRYYTAETAELAEKQKTLDDLSTAILKAYISALSTPKGWLQEVVDAVVHPEAAAASRDHRLLVSEACLQYPSAHMVEATTAEHYHTIAGILQRFAASGRTLYVGSVSQDDLDDLVEFMRCETIVGKDGVARQVERGRNTISTKLHKLRSVLRWCRARGLTDNCPFDGYAIPEEIYGTPTFLTLEERDALLRFQGLPPRLAEARDIFVFQCHIGCRIGDLYALKRENITEDGRFIQYMQLKRKTSDPITIRVPLTQTAKDLLAKYSGRRLRSGRLFPFPSEQIYNERIRMVLRLAGITRKVIVQDSVSLQPVVVEICDVASSHMARRTFMANMFKATKSERITSSFTGHSEGSKAFKRYTDVDDEMKLEVIQHLATSEE